MIVCTWSSSGGRRVIKLTMLWSSRSMHTQKCITPGRIVERTVRTWTLPAWETVMSGAALGLLARLSYQAGS